MSVQCFQGPRVVLGREERLCRHDKHHTQRPILGSRHQFTHIKQSRRKLRVAFPVASSASGGYAAPQEPSYSSAEEDADGKVGFGGALINVLNILSGIGLLSVPYALQKAGWVGLGVLWLLGIVTNYTGKILVESVQEVAARKQKEAGASVAISDVGYEDIGEAAYGSFGRKIVSASIYTELIGICSLLFVVEGKNMFKLLGTKLAPNPDTYILIAAACMIPTVWLPDLKALSVLGVFGFAATLLMTATIGYVYLTKRFVVGALTRTATWSQVPVIFGVLAFVYAGHGVFPSIQASMKKPKEFPKVLNTAYVILASLCTFLGVLGYKMYGANVADVVTFNLPQGLPSTLCASIILLIPFAKLALTLEPVASAATDAATSKTQGLSDGVRRLGVRTALALFCLFIACNVPHLALLMGLIGSLFTIATAILLPVAIHTRIFKGQLGGAQKAWNFVVFAIGLGCAIAGGAISISDIAKAMRAG